MSRRYFPPAEQELGVFALRRQRQVCHKEREASGANPRSQRPEMRTNENLEPVAILNICFIAFDDIAAAIGFCVTCVLVPTHRPFPTVATIAQYEGYFDSHPEKQTKSLLFTYGIKENYSWQVNSRKIWSRQPNQRTGV